MSKNKIFSELFRIPKETFSKHIKLEGNHRILFSGRFGVGKTTFVNHYFLENSDKYDVVNIYPVNYSVLDSEDIFKYIKYDVILSLFGKGNRPSSPDFGTLFKDVPSFIIDNFLPLFGTLALLSDKLSKPIHTYLNDLDGWKKKYEEYIETRDVTERKEIEKFITSLHNDERGLFDYGAITTIIVNWIQYLKFDSGKESILIIDDLDRIDPKHIFRILNIFSAHFDRKNNDESKNKFGFDKIILICDIDNIHNIYKAQYGVSTDFNGYIDKFFSKDIYRFDNNEDLKNIISEVFSETYFGTPKVDRSGQVAFGLWQEGKQSKQLSYVFIENLIENRLINIRNLLSYSSSEIDVNKDWQKFNDIVVKPFNNGILFSFWFISKIMGGLNPLQEKFEIARSFKNINNSNEFEYILANLAMLVSDVLIMSNNSQMNVRTGISEVELNGYMIKIDVNKYGIYKESFSARFVGLFNSDKEDVSNSINNINWIDLLVKVSNKLSD